MTIKVHSLFLIFLLFFGLPPNLLKGLGPNPNLSNEIAGTAIAGECLFCDAPFNLSQANVGPVFDFWWNSVFNAAGYQIEIGEIGFEPGTGADLYLLAPTGSNYFGFEMQGGNIQYEAYIRTICNDGDTSAFNGPFFLVVPPSCGDTIYDSGGPDGDISPDEQIQTSICPNTSDEYVELVFNDLDIDPCCGIILLRTSDLFEIVTSNGDEPSVFSSLVAGECIDFEFIGFNDTSSGRGWDISIDCVACPSVPKPVLQNITSDQVQFRWGLLGDISTVSWEIGEPGFVPFAGNDIFSGNAIVTSLILVINGLASNTQYEIYFRNECGADISSYNAPILFSTAPTCGENFYDLGGPNEPIPSGNIQDIPATSCPNTPGEAIVADFDSFDLGDNSQLSVFDGTLNSSELLAVLEGTGTAGPFISSDQTGCLTFDYARLDTFTHPGWEAAISCTTCPLVNHYQVQNTGLESAVIGWLPLINAVNYEWEVGEPGFIPGTGAAIVSSTTQGFENFAGFDGLEKNTIYEIYVRGLCSAENSSYFHSLHFSTQATCGDLFLDSGGSSSQYENDLSYQTTICSTEPNDPVTVQFNLFNTEACCDFLSVYDNANITFGFLGTFSGSTSPGTFTATNSTGCLTFDFSSNESIAGIGWEAVIFCNAVPTIETTKVEMFELFPNPATEQVNLAFKNKGASGQSIEVRDVNGIRFYEESNVQDDLPITTADWPVGTYFVVLKNENNVVTKRFVKSY